MKRFFLNLLVITTVFIATVVNISAANLPKDTVLAEFDGGKITVEDLDNRIARISPMYQSRYKTEDAKQNLLKNMCIEELFYQEALAKGLQNDEKIKLRNKYIKISAYSRVFKRNQQKEFKVPEKDLKDYYIKYADSLYAGRTFEESKTQIELKLRPQYKKNLFKNMKNDLYKKFDVKIDTANIKLIDLTDMDKNLEIGNKVIVSGSKDILNMTVSDFVKYFGIIDKQQASLTKTSKDLLNMIDKLTEMKVFYLEAKEKGYDNNEEVKKEYDQAVRKVLLQNIYQQIVLDKIDTTLVALKKFYDENPDKFSSKEYRKIQAFTFDDEKKANKIRKKIIKLAKKGKEEEISKLLKANCLHPENNGIKDYIYKNNIIPGIGKDIVYSETVWKTEPNKVSDVFKNSKDEFVFVRILEDHKAEVPPFEQIKEKVRKTYMRTKSREKFEEVSAELEKKYHLKKYPEKLINKLTAEEYFTKAEEAQKKRRFNDALFYYDKIIKYYPNNTDDYKAMFMKGFIYSEDLHKKDEALEIFREFLEKYPEGELTESAEFMIKELSGESNVLKSIEENKNN
ncbi:MAG: hypothetical protein B6D62_01675 [Candidatus Cloacimonas sp. 4484_275]|nr:MAG: hypothetical protein B6D62_01675 [Candidatus Cloacimonas sp. 4484_275]RLC52783.1 MAG: hypothetical protein DRZ79_00590 [Candidatus Cloacimonadota bacterium]